jgi:arachidonate 15-lipoxygenase
MSVSIAPLAFTRNNPVSPGYPRKFTRGATAISLPQYDNTSEKRSVQLKISQKIYRFKYDYDALPGVPMGLGLPITEAPSLEWIRHVSEIDINLAINRALNDLSVGHGTLFDRLKVLAYNGVRFFRAKADPTYLKNLLKQVEAEGPEALISALSNTAITNYDASRASVLKDYKRLFKTIPVPEVEKDFGHDACFARQRVAGLHPTMLQQVPSDFFPNNDFPVTDAILNTIAGFEDDSLYQAGIEGRLYMVDYHELATLVPSDSGYGQKYGYSPKALFALKADDLTGQLHPIAIQCAQTPEEANHSLFTPGDGDAWEKAKTTVQVADLNHHEIVAHLTGTHLFIEPFVVSTHRQLSTRHPLFRLLCPHFEGTMFINLAAELALVNDGGIFDQIFFAKMDSVRALVGKALSTPLKERCLPRRLKSRGLLNRALDHPYRDDALQYWAAIESWVTNYVEFYYANDGDIKNDRELQAWAEELASESGGRVAGMPDIDNRADLIEVLTLVIFTSSVEHAAVNFPQKTYAAYVPNMPAAQYLPAPSKEQEGRRAAWLEMLPPMNVAELQMTLMESLAGYHHIPLGNYGKKYFRDKRIRSYCESFNNELDRISDSIRARNTAVTHPYTTLIRELIPASINV